MLHANQIGTVDEKHENDEPDDAHNESRHNEGHAPVGIDVMRCYVSSQHISNGCVRVPNAENQAALRLAAPSWHDGNDRGPASRLKDTGEALHGDEVKHRVDVFGFGVAERVAEEAGEQHAQRQEISEGNAFRDESREEHCNRVADEEAGVEDAQQGAGVNAV